MENKRILFITFDMSGYYTSMYEELKRRYEHVDYYNTAKISYKYKSIFQKGYAFFYKMAKGQKLKNLYKYQSVIDAVKDKEYDITLIIRPDLFFDSQLEVLKKNSGSFIAFYHDSINNIKRKKDVIRFFDKVYSYEKKDVKDYDLTFISNFIYDTQAADFKDIEYDAFSVMSNDYRLPALKKIAEFLKSKGYTFNFYIMDDKFINDNLITFMTKRMSNDEVIRNIKKAKIIVDIHKYGIQDGLTFRTFESLGFRKKLITTNQDIKAYDFYDPENIFVIEDVHKIDIPEAFFSTPYKEIPEVIYRKYTVAAWLEEVMA